jgi:hypothetical protein
MIEFSVWSISRERVSLELDVERMLTSTRRDAMDWGMPATVVGADAGGAEFSALIPE